MKATRFGTLEIPKFAFESAEGPILLGGCWLSDGEDPGQAALDLLKEMANHTGAVTWTVEAEQEDRCYRRWAVAVCVASAAIIVASLVLLLLA